MSNGSTSIGGIDVNVDNLTFETLRRIRGYLKPFLFPVVL